MRKMWSGFSREYKLLFLTWLFIGITGGIYDTVFNNYINEVFHISAQVRGYLEFPREFPGFLVAIVSGLLMFMADVRMLGVAVSLITVGMLGQSFYSWQGQPQFGWMIFTMLIWSVGTHLFMPLSSSVCLKLSQQGKLGKSLGQLNGATTAASIIGSLSIWLLIGWLKLEYSWAFRLAAFFGLIAIVCVFMMKVGGGQTKPEPEKFHFRLVFRKEYSLFYWLSVLFGARKQIFMTFAPWVIVKIYGESAIIFATLLIIASLIGIFFKPWLGRLIDHLGERKILMAEAVSLVIVCLGYGFAGHLGLGKYAIYLVFLCYICDNLLLGASMARTTYLHKNLVAESDLTPTLSMGISLDHFVSMSIPILGGLLWAWLGYEVIFLLAAAIALINLFAASKVRDKQTVSHQTVSASS